MESAYGLPCAEHEEHGAFVLCLMVPPWGRKEGSGAEGDVRIRAASFHEAGDLGHCFISYRINETGSLSGEACSVCTPKSLPRFGVTIPLSEQCLGRLWEAERRNVDLLCNERVGTRTSLYCWWSRG